MATISATIRINDGFSSALTSLSSKLSAAGNAMNRLKGQGTSTGGMFKNMLGANIVGSGITAGISAIGSGMHNMLTTLDENSKAWQTFNGNMKNIGRTPAQIAKVRSSLQDFAHQTIYSASDMASAYSQFAAVGTKGTLGLVKGMGGLAAAADDPQQAMKTLMQQSIQAAAKPKIQWQDFRLMLEQTPAGMAAVSKTMHTSLDGLIKDIQAGKVSSQDFFNAINKTGNSKGFQSMATQFKTVGQALDGFVETLSDKLGHGYQTASQIAIKAISGITNKVSGLNFNGFNKLATGLTKGLLGGLRTASQAVKTFMGGLADTGALTAASSAFKSIGNAVKNVVSSLSSAGGNPFGMFDTLGKIAGGALKGAANAIKAISNVIGNLDPSSIKLLGAAFIALKAGAKGLVLTAIVAGLTALGKLNPGTLNALAKALGVLAIGLLTLKTLGKVDGILTGLSSSLSGFGKAGGLAAAGESAKTAAVGFIKLGASLLMVGAAILMAGAGFYLIANAAIQLTTAGWPAIAMFFAMIATIAILAVLVTVLGTAMIAGAVGFLIFGAAVLLVGAGVFLAATGLAMLATQLPIIATYGISAAVSLLAFGAAMAAFGVLSIVAAAGLVLLGAALIIIGVGFIVAAVGAILFGVGITLVAAMSLVAGVGLLLMAVGLVLVAPLMLVAAVGALLLSVGLVLMAAVAIVAAVGLIMLGVGLAIAAPLMLLAAAGALALGVAAIILGAGLMVAAAGINAVTSAISNAVSGFARLVSAATSAASGMVNAIVSGMSRVSSAISNGISSAVNTVGSFVGDMVSAGADLINGLVQGIGSAIGKAVSAVRAGVSKVVGAAKGLLGIGSPSKLFRQYGIWLMQGLANGINDNNAAVIASSQMAKNVVRAADEMQLPSLDAGNILANGFNQATNAVYSLVEALHSVDGTTVGINQKSMSVGLPESSSLGNMLDTGSTTQSPQTGLQSGNSSTITIAKGAIQINSQGNSQQDLESLIQQFENYLVNRQQNRLGVEGNE